MISNKKAVVLIPARGNSKRVYRKNMQSLFGVPLIGYAINTALDLNVDEVYVSTEDEHIARIAKIYGATVPFIRPTELSCDNSTDYQVFSHFLQWYIKTNNAVPEYIIQIRATSPIRNKDDIIKAIELFEANPQADSLRTVSLPHQTPYKMWRLNNGRLEAIMNCETEAFYDKSTQSLPEVFAQDGVLDIVRSRTILEQGTMSGSTIYGMVTSGAYDIDDYNDLSKATKLLRQARLPIGSLGSRIGIIQGRLTEAEVLQQFPKSNWEGEFGVATSIGYAHMELFRDREYNNKNPLWTGDVDGIIALKLLHGISTPVICDDYAMNFDWANLSAENVEAMADLFVYAKKIDCLAIVLPLMGKAELTEKNYTSFILHIKRIAKIAHCHGLEILFEANCTAEKMKQVIEDINAPNVGVCLDSGNLTEHGISPMSWVKELGQSIRHIHIKDKLGKNNVAVGSGDVDFSFLQRLIKQGYRHRLTFESTRGEEPVETATKNLRHIMGILEAEQLQGEEVVKGSKQADRVVAPLCVIPEEGKEIIEAVKQELSKLFNGRSYGMYGTGSLGYGGFVENWSDFDIDVLFEGKNKEESDFFYREGRKIHERLNKKFGIDRIDLRIFGIDQLNSLQTLSEFGQCSRLLMLIDSALFIKGIDYRHLLIRPSKEQIDNEAFLLLSWLLSHSMEWWKALPWDDISAFFALSARFVITNSTQKIHGKKDALEYLLKNHASDLDSTLFAWVVWARCMRERKEDILLNDAFRVEASLEARRLFYKVYQMLFGTKRKLAVEVLNSIGDLINR